MEDRQTTILIVEDNPDHAELMEKALSKEPGRFKTNITDSGEECWSMLDQQKYDLVILDYTLPKLDGLEVLKGIIKRGHSVPVVIVTGHGDEQTAVDVIKSGAYDYVTKSGGFPVTLPLIVRKAIERYSLSQEREKLQQEIKETKEYLENLLENANDIVYTLNVNAEVTYVNKKIEEYGIRREDLIGKDFFSLLPGTQSKEKIKDSIMGGTKQRLEIEITDKRGEIKYVVISTFPLRDDQGNVISISGIARDVTDTRRLKQKQHEMEIELMEQHKLSSTGILVQGVAHNMNSPLTGILGRSQLLEHRLKKQRDGLASLLREAGIEGIEETIQTYDKAIRDAMLINDNVDRLAGIIKNMMYKSRQEQAEGPQMININELLREELAFLEADMFFKHEVTKKYDLDESVPYIKAVYGNFSQSIVNIVRNSLDAMHDSKIRELTVTTRFEGDNIYVDIHDTGVGIREEDMPKIFDPFFTTKPSNTSDGSPTGIGLGLHSCYIMLKKYGVKIDARSRPGDTTLMLRIPLKNNGMSKERQ